MPRDRMREHEVLLMDTLVAMREARAAADRYNDFGSVLGICDEMNSIESDLSKALASAAARASRVALRITKYEEGDHRVGHLDDKVFEPNDYEKQTDESKNET